MSGVRLVIDGPHSPEYTAEVAGTLAECVRVLNHATRSQDGLRYPADLYTVLGELQITAARLPQLLTQLSGWLDGQARAGGLAEAAGGRFRDAAAAVATARSELARADRSAHTLTAALEAAHQAVSGLYGPTGNGED